MRLPRFIYAVLLVALAIVVQLTINARTGDDARVVQIAGRRGYVSPRDRAFVDDHLRRQFPATRPVPPTTSPAFADGGE
jgi:hypothetical protein